MKTFYEDPDGICLCTHEPIRWHMVLRNKFNGNEIVVGNVCVKHFSAVDESDLLDRDSADLVQAIPLAATASLSRLSRSATAYEEVSANKLLINLAHRCGALTLFERDQYYGLIGAGSRGRFNRESWNFSQEAYDSRAELNVKIRDFFWGGEEEREYD